jgi:hypothetical protein
MEVNEMTVRELNREQLDELKVKYVCDLYDNPTYGDLADAHTICDEELFIHYDGIDFVEEDFFCGKEEN